MLRKMLIFMVVFITAVTFCNKLLPAQSKFQDIEIANPKIRLIGKLHKPLGEYAKIEGIVVEGNYKGYEDGPNIIVQRIDGKMTQEFVQIVLDVFNPEGGDNASYGKSYELEGYETGGFSGISFEAYHKAGDNMGVQSAEHYFRHSFIAIKSKAIEPLVWSPADFVDRKALLAGKAENIGSDAFISTKDWKLLAQKNQKWPDKKLAKEVEGFGTIRKTTAKDIYSLENGTTHLVRLEDQLGENVELRGIAKVTGTRWCVDYRGKEVYIDGLDKLPGWTGELHYMPVQINGTLEETNIDLNSGKPVAKKIFVVRKPTWKKIDGLLTPEIKLGRD
jgi:hypothetical protein